VLYTPCPPCPGTLAAIDLNALAVSAEEKKTAREVSGWLGGCSPARTFLVGDRYGRAQTPSGLFCQSIPNFPLWGGLGICQSFISAGAIRLRITGFGGRCVWYTNSFYLFSSIFSTMTAMGVVLNCYARLKAYGSRFLLLVFFSFVLQNGVQIPLEKAKSSHPHTKYLLRACHEPMPPNARSRDKENRELEDVYVVHLDDL
jgi:hypothetical protein